MVCATKTRIRFEDNVLIKFTVSLLERTIRILAVYKYLIFGLLRRKIFLLYENYVFLIWFILKYSIS